MKTYLYLSLIVLFSFTSCTTVNHVHYSDPNYLNENEFSSYEEITNTYIEDQDSTSDITSAENEKVIINNYYEADDYYDFSYSSRIRRFHRPMWHSGYYGGIYTDYYWYNNDPFYCGSSIYLGYNWHSPYYSYSPYYYNYYHTPYYSGYYGYLHNTHHYYHYSYNPTYSYNNSLDKNSYNYGHRGSLSNYSNKAVKNYKQPNNSSQQLNTNRIKNKWNKIPAQTKGNIKNIESKKRETGRIKKDNVSREKYNFNNKENRSKTYNNSNKESNYKSNNRKSYNTSKPNRSYKQNNRSGSKPSKSRSIKPRKQ